MDPQMGTQMNPQMMQLYNALMGQMQQQPPQIPNAQAGAPQMPQRPPVQPMAAPPTPQAQPGMGQQAAQTGVSAGVTAGASAVNPVLGIMAQMIMPYLLQSLFGRPKQQPGPAQVIPAPR